MQNDDCSEHMAVADTCDRQMSTFVSLNAKTCCLGGWREALGTQNCDRRAHDSSNQEMRRTGTLQGAKR